MYFWASSVLPFYVSKSELRTFQLVEIWLNPHERCCEQGGEKICYAVNDDKGIWQELSRNNGGNVHITN